MYSIGGKGSSSTCGLFSCVGYFWGNSVVRSAKVEADYLMYLTPPTPPTLCVNTVEPRWGKRDGLSNIYDFRLLQIPKTEEQSQSCKEEGLCIL